MKPLAEAIRASCNVEVRQATDDGQYFEAVLKQDDLARCMALIQAALGPPLKDFHQPVTLPTEVRAIVDRFGGLRPNQCLFFKRDGGQASFAMFWPWESDPAFITLKLGTA